MKAASFAIALLLSAQMLTPTPANAEASELERLETCAAMLVITGGWDSPSHKMMMERLKGAQPNVDMSALRDSTRARSSRLIWALVDKRTDATAFMKVTEICARKYAVPMPPDMQAQINATVANAERIRASKATTASSAASTNPQPTQASPVTPEQRMLENCTAYYTIADGPDGPEQRKLMTKLRKSQPAGESADTWNERRVKVLISRMEQDVLPYDRFTQVVYACHREYYDLHIPTTMWDNTITIYRRGNARRAAATAAAATARPQPTQAMKDEVDLLEKRALDYLQRANDSLKLAIAASSRKWQCTYARGAYSSLTASVWNISQAKTKAKAYNLGAERIADLEAKEKKTIELQNKTETC